MILEPVPEWSVLDSSKIKTAQSCLRKYFYEYVLGWRLEGYNINLEFGSAWHRAQEHMLVGLQTGQGYSAEIIQEAYEAFTAYYEERFPQDTWEPNAPKNPEGALDGLVKYARKYQDDAFEVLYTEVAGTVPIDDTHKLCFKIDAIVRDQSGLIYILDHKTTKMDSDARKREHDLSTQVGTYLHAALCQFDLNEVGGFLVNLAIFRKATKKGLGFAHYRIPIEKTPEQMDDWLFTTLYWIETIEQSMEALDSCTKEEDILHAFPKNPNACCQWGVCPFHNICIAQSYTNPLLMCEKTPPGYIIEHWDPRKREESAKYVFDGETIVEREDGSE